MKQARTMLLAALLAGTMPAAPALADEWRSLDEGVRPNEQRVIGGQPTAALLRAAAEAGIEVVVNFRPAVELGKAHGLTHFEDEVRAELARYAEESPQP